jgi:hypothetical protein
MMIWEVMITSEDGGGGDAILTETDVLSKARSFVMN